MHSTSEEQVSLEDLNASIALEAFSVGAECLEDTVILSSNFSIKSIPDSITDNKVSSANNYEQPNVKENGLEISSANNSQQLEPNENGLEMQETNQKGLYIYS